MSYCFPMSLQGFAVVHHIMCVEREMEAAPSGKFEKLPSCYRRISISIA